MYVTKLSNDSINELNLSTPWQVNTAVQTSSVIVSATALGGENAPTGIDISDNGLVILVIGAGKDAIHQYNLSIPWQANTATYIGNTSISNRELGPMGINITKDGYYIYFIGDSQDYVWQYELGLLS
jgi:DNA-binding beta-propeller fold protein YncE